MVLNIWNYVLYFYFFLLTLSFLSPFFGEKDALALGLHRPHSPYFETMAEQKCVLNSGDPVAMGQAGGSFLVPYGAKMGGYGLFPFSPFLGRLADAGASVSSQVLIFSQGGNHWALVTADLIGLHRPLVLQIEAAVKKSLRESATGGGGCEGVTVVATHTHSAVDSIGLWGGLARGLDPWANRAYTEAAFEIPLLEEIGKYTKQALLSLHNVQILRVESLVPTNVLQHADTTRSPLGLSGSENLSFNLTQLWFSPSPSPSPSPSQIGGGGGSDGSGGVEGMGLLWIWDAHAATDDPGQTTVSGDFAQRVRGELAGRQGSGNKRTAAVYLPGSIGGSYPQEEVGWEDNLLGVLQQGGEFLAETGSSSGFSVEWRRREYCLEVTSHFGALLEKDAALWGGGPSAAPCAFSGKWSGKSVADTSGLTGRTIALDEVVFRKSGNAQRSTLVFSPFEVFSDVAKNLSMKHTSWIQFVSLSGGFMGYGLSLPDSCFLLSTADRMEMEQCVGLTAAEKRQGAATKYHLALATVTEVETLLGDFLVK